MLKKTLLYSAGLIALYLVVVNATGFSKDVTSGASGGTSLVKAFQGR